MLKLYKGLLPYTLPLIVLLVFIIIQVNADLTLPTIMSRIIDEGIVKSDLDYIKEQGLIMAGVSFISLASSVMVALIGAWVATRLSANIRHSLFMKVSTFSIKEIDEFSTSSLITRTTNDVLQIQNFTVMMFRMMVAAPFTAGLAIYYAYQKDPSLVWIIYVTVPVILGLMIIVGLRTMNLFGGVQTRIDKVNSVLRENLQGLRIIRAFNKITFEESRFEKANRELADRSIQVNKIMAIIMPLIMLVMYLAQIALVWFGAVEVDKGGLMVGDLMAMISYIMQFMFALVMMSIVFISLPRALASAKRINEVMAVEPAICDDCTVAPVEIKESGKIKFDNVSFKFDGAEEYALENINFETTPGKVFAIIGGTGSGKSTILNLVLRFFDVTDGQVLVNGENVKNYQIHELRDLFGYVSQKAILFSDTIKNNIKYGREDATDEEVIKAAQIAQAHDFIMTKELGYDDEISQGGKNLSGGQKQRLSIARAICSAPQFYLFDDSFSALDFKTDSNLRKALKEELNEATMIIVAQRVSTIMDADQIVVLDDGRIAGIGTHTSLMKSCEVYQEIVASQFQKEDEING